MVNYLHLLCNECFAGDLPRKFENNTSQNIATDCLSDLVALSHPSYCPVQVLLVWLIHRHATLVTAIVWSKLVNY